MAKGLQTNDTQTAIRRAAKTCFSRQGYIETTIRDVAKLAGISPATIYSYYRGKKELFDSLEIPEMELVRPEYEKKRAETIRAALVLFGEKGVEGTTMDEIASAVGISKATLYLYCDNKEDLFAQVLQESAFNTFSKKVTLIDQTMDWKEAVKTVGREYLTISTQPERVALLRAIIRDSAKYPEIGNLYYEQGFLSACKDVVQFLKNSWTKEVDEKQLFIAVHTYFGSLQSYILMHSTISGIQMTIEAEDYLDVTTTLFIDGLVHYRENL